MCYIQSVILQIKSLRKGICLWKKIVYFDLRTPLQNLFSFSCSSGRPQSFYFSLAQAGENVLSVQGNSDSSITAELSPRVSLGMGHLACNSETQALQMPSQGNPFCQSA